MLNKLCQRVLLTFNAQGQTFITLGICLLSLLWGSCVLPAVSASERTLLDAVRYKDFPRAAQLLDASSDPNLASADGTTALHWATHWNTVDLVEQLLDRGASVDATNRFGITPLMLACINGNESVVHKLLVARADANRVSRGGEPTILTAARSGNSRVVELLLKHGAQPNAQEPRMGQTALMWAAAEGHVKTVNALLAGGAQRDVRSKGGFTAFLFAVRHGHQPVVHTLLDAGEDVNQFLSTSSSVDWNSESDDQTGRGPSALGLAAINAHFELAAMLLMAGADPNYQWQGHSLLHEITWIRKPGAGSNDPVPEGSGQLTSLELVRLLVEHGADVNARMMQRKGARTTLNLKGATPFLLAARTTDTELMQQLVDLGADPLLPNEDNTTPLLVAAGVGVQSPGEDPGTPAEVLETVKLALALGNDVNAVDNRGETVMHGVAYKYAASSVELLVNSGARIDVWNRKNKMGWTPLRIATGVHRTMNLRSSPETAAAIRRAMIAAGVTTQLEPETNISGATN